MTLKQALFHSFSLQQTLFVASSVRSDKKMAESKHSSYYIKHKLKIKKYSQKTDNEMNKTQSKLTNQ